MKNIKIVTLLLVIILALVGCQSSQKSELKNEQSPEQMEINEKSNGNVSTQIMAEATANDFIIQLYADNSAYSTDDAIKIWATLEYIGEQEIVTIWHGEPYIVFSITDGKDFHTGGAVLDILTSSELKKGELYHFEHVKSGGWDTQGPDADFWESFYQEEDLKLPAGTYTVTVDGAFYLSKQISSAPKGPSCELQITVK